MSSVRAKRAERMPIHTEKMKMRYGTHEKESRLKPIRLSKITPVRYRLPDI